MRTIEIGKKVLLWDKEIEQIKLRLLGGPRIIENVILHQFLQFLKVATNENVAGGQINRAKKKSGQRKLGRVFLVTQIIKKSSNASIFTIPETSYYVTITIKIGINSFCCGTLEHLRQYLDDFF